MPLIKKSAASTQIRYILEVKIKSKIIRTVNVAFNLATRSFTILDETGQSAYFFMILKTLFMDTDEKKEIPYMG